MIRKYNYFIKEADRNLEILKTLISYNSITEITLPGNITKIRDHCFRDLTIERLILPVSIVYIGRSVFNWADIKEIIYSGTIEQWNNIEKDPEWSYGLSLNSISCSDGNISI